MRPVRPHNLPLDFRTDILYHNDIAVAGLFARGRPRPSNPTIHSPFSCSAFHHPSFFFPPSSFTRASSFVPLRFAGRIARGKRDYPCASPSTIHHSRLPLSTLHFLLSSSFFPPSSLQRDSNLIPSAPDLPVTYGKPARFEPHFLRVTSSVPTILGARRREQRSSA